MAKKAVKSKNYIIGKPIKTGKRGTAAAWGQEIGEIIDGKKYTSMVYSDKKSDFTGSSFQNYKKGAKRISKDEFIKL